MLISSLVLATWFPGCAREHHLRCAMGLLWGAEVRLQHSWQMSTVQDPRKTWLAPWSLLTVWSSLVANGSVWATSLLAISVRCAFCVFLLLLLLLVMLLSEIAKLPHRPACDRVSYCVETSPSRLPPQVGSLSLNLLSMLLSSLFCPTSFQREWAPSLGAWCPLLAFRSCSVEVAQHSNDLLMNLWGGK